jgi:hypothetical protein
MQLMQQAARRWQPFTCQADQELHAHLHCLQCYLSIPHLGSCHVLAKENFQHSRLLLGEVSALQVKMGWQGVRMGW